VSRTRAALLRGRDDDNRRALPAAGPCSEESELRPPAQVLLMGKSGSGKVQSTLRLSSSCVPLGAWQISRALLLLLLSLFLCSARVTPEPPTARSPLPGRIHRYVTDEARWLAPPCQTSMRNVIFQNTLPSLTHRLGATIDVEQSHQVRQPTFDSTA